MAGGIGGGISGGVIRGVAVGGGPTTDAAIPPTNSVKPDEFISLAETVVVNRQNAADISTEGVRRATRLLSQQTGTAARTVTGNTNFIRQELSRLGIDFSPKENPLNVYANYTYHIRWFMTDESAAYNNISKTNPNADSINKTIIAESGVTAGFNITDFEMETTCGPNAKTLNTVSTTWSMTITEPYGISLIDKMRSAAKTQPIINYMRAPYFIDIWFTGYDENGKVVDDKLFYQLFRVNIIDMEATLTEGGSKYSISGYFDNDFGFSNQVSIPAGGLSIQAKTVGEFFKKLEEKLTEQQKKILQQNFADLEYKIKVPPEMRDWTFRAADPESQDSRNADMSLEVTEGTMNVTINLGMSIEVIVNRVISMCPEADPWVKGETSGGTAGSNSAEITTNGFASWLMVHSDVKIIGFNYYTRDYIREVTYTLVRYRTARTGADAATLVALESLPVQKEKINFLKSQGAINKLYQYIYTGQNTEIIRYEIKVENFWSITLPAWEGVNSYYNQTQGPLAKPNAIGDQLRQGTYTKPQLLNAMQSRIETIQQSINSVDIGFRNSLLAEQAALSRDALFLEASMDAAVFFNQPLTAENNRDRQATSSPGQLTTNSALLKDEAARQEVAEIATFRANQKALRYVEDLNVIIAKEQDPMPIVIKPDNQPSGQNAALSSDSNKSVASPNSLGLPSGRTFIGTILGNMFDPTFFMNIEIEIRGDPYWMGQSNIRQSAIADTYGRSGSDPRFANYQVCDHTFVLVFRSGENYNEQTGMMEFTETSDFFNGVYNVLTSKNTFRNGSFTQTLSAYKDTFAQKISNQVSAVATETASTVRTGPQ